MPNITPARLSLALATLLACKPGTGDTASDTDPSTGSTAGTPSTGLTDTEGNTSTGDPATSTSTSEGASTTAEPTTNATTDHGTTSTGVVSCGGGWCAAKDSLNIIIMDNHEPPHELVIPAFDADACVERTYEFTGAADHTHTLTITPTDFAIIDAGGQIEIESSEAEGHTHLVWSDCE